MFHDIDVFEWMEINKIYFKNISSVLLLLPELKDEPNRKEEIIKEIQESK